MKKDRNTFFQESGFFNNQSVIPNQMVANQPMNTYAQGQQSFYMGPPIPNNYNMNNPQMANQNYTYDTSDIESRLSKIERNLNRIDARLNKLESQNLYTTEDIDVSSNMYMV